MSAPREENWRICRIPGFKSTIIPPPPKPSEITVATCQEDPWSHFPKVEEFWPSRLVYFDQMMTWNAHCFSCGEWAEARIASSQNASNGSNFCLSCVSGGAFLVRKFMGNKRMKIFMNPPNFSSATPTSAPPPPPDDTDTEDDDDEDDDDDDMDTDTEALQQDLEGYTAIWKS